MYPFLLRKGLCTKKWLSKNLKIELLIKIGEIKEEGYNNNNHVLFDLPTGVWESEFPPCNSSVLRGSRKGDPYTKVVWGKTNTRAHTSMYVRTDAHRDELPESATPVSTLRA